MRRTATVCLLLVSVLGCRSVWVHPEATHARFNEDLYRCQFGAEPPSVAAFRSSDRPVVELRQDWKLCMASLGWERDTRFRSSEPYAKK
jgi:hypothetical protein